MHDCRKSFQIHPEADNSCMEFYTWLYTFQIQGSNGDLIIHVYINMAIIGKKKHEGTLKAWEASIAGIIISNVWRDSKDID